MTAKTPLPPHDCPFEWCQSTWPGDEHTHIEYTPASASTAPAADGLYVGIHLSFLPEEDGSSPQIGAHICGTGVDAEGFMTVAEASTLRDLLATAITRAEEVAR